MVDETYIKGKWYYLYQAIDKRDNLKGGQGRMIY